MSLARVAREGWAAARRDDRRAQAGTSEEAASLVRGDHRVTPNPEAGATGAANRPAAAAALGPVPAPVGGSAAR